MNLASLVTAHEADRPAIRRRDGTVSWGEIRARAAAAAAGLRELGVAEGDRVALAWPTSEEFVVAYLAVLAAGAVAVPLNPASPPAELAREAAAVTPTAMIAAPAGADALGLLTGAELGVRTVVLPDGRSAPSWEDLSTPDPAGPAFDPVGRAPGDPAVLLFTSGTAGAAKPAILTHGNLVANLAQMASVPGELVQAADVGYAAIPLFHVFGLNVALGLALASGASLVLEERFSAAGALEAVRDLGVTLLVGAPPMFRDWLDLPEEAAPEGVLQGVRRAVSGASALDPEVAVGFERRFGVPVWQGYGLTEAAPVVSTTLGTGHNRPGSVGRPLPGVEVRLVDDAGEEVLEGDPGEIWVRGDNVFPGYWQDPEATAEVLVDGWLRTGDVAVLGDDGDLFIVDRKKDLVIVSGFNVFPAEVERILAEHPSVAEAAVVGAPDPRTGETVEAVVVPRSGSQPTADELIAHCQRRLARYKCPTRVRFTDRLPRNVSGKPLRRTVRQP